MNFIYQEHGLINRYYEKIHIGTQPIRVLHQMLIYMFINTNKYFINELLKQINIGILKSEINLLYGAEPIKENNSKYRTPRVNFTTKQIELHETFLSFLWCIVYSVYVNYVEKINFPKYNKEKGEILYPISQDNIDKAQEIFLYAKYLIIDFKVWDLDELPNPEVYQAEKRIYIEQTDVLYTEAVKFILCHEFTHLKKHSELINEETTNSQYLSFEVEADNNSIDLLTKGISYSFNSFDISQRISTETGIIFGILSMFFFSANTGGLRHPNTEDRLTNALERLRLDEDHDAWGIACIGLQMWDEQFGHNFIWNKEHLSYKKQYYEIISQIKSLL